MPRRCSTTSSNALFFELFLKINASQLRKIIKNHGTVIEFKGFVIPTGALENFLKGYKTVSRILQKTAKFSSKTCRKACPHKTLKQVAKKTINISQNGARRDPRELPGGSKSSQDRHKFMLKIIIGLLTPLRTPK